MTDLIHIKRALISVSNKTGIAELAKKLVDLNIEIISTGGTAHFLQSHGVPVKLVSDITQFPEIMSGRVKTLHPKIHGAILGKRDTHQQEAEENHIDWIDCVICNLYPFENTVKEKKSLSDCVEQIDVGGPAMIRAAAKNCEWVTVITDPDDYDLLFNAIQHNQIDFDFRKTLAAKAFTHTSQYDAVIAHYLNHQNMPEQFTIPFQKIKNCRYGENPHQQAAVYRNKLEQDIGILDAQLLQGKELSFNNIYDASAALHTVMAYSTPACVIVKHANPCGAAIAETIDHAFEKAWHADSLSAFGGVIALNRPCTEKIALFLTTVFVEVIIAPEFSKSALQILSRKKNVRVLWQTPWPSQFPKQTAKWITGGLLWQTSDDSYVDEKNFRVVTKKSPTSAEIAAMHFAWPILKQLKSNAVVIAKPDATISMGAGQVSRVDAVKLAIQKMPHAVEHVILASEAFFPFVDCIELIARTNIKAIIQPGGSIKDNEIIQACDQHHIAMVFTGVRCFNH